MFFNELLHSSSQWILSKSHLLKKTKKWRTLKRGDLDINEGDIMINRVFQRLRSGTNMNRMREIDTRTLFSSIPLSSGFGSETSRPFLCASEDLSALRGEKMYTMAQVAE